VDHPLPLKTRSNPILDRCFIPEPVIFGCLWKPQEPRGTGETLQGSAIPTLRRGPHLPAYPKNDPETNQTVIGRLGNAMG